MKDFLSFLVPAMLTICLFKTVQNQVFSIVATEYVVITCSNNYYVYDAWKLL